jgi:hypothetical protein
MSVVTSNQIELNRKVKKGIIEHTLSSWWKFAEFTRDPDLSWPTLIYRGQANANWKVESTLDRLEKRVPTQPYRGNSKYFKTPRVHRELQLKRFKELARGKFVLEIPPQDDEDDEWWALAQHYGLATPMMDWTYCPFVALFFAFEEEKCDCKDGYSVPEFRVLFALAHQLLSKDKQKKERPQAFSPMGHANYRLTNQGGLFLKMPKNTDLESWVKRNFRKETYEEPKSNCSGNLHPALILQKFIIHNNDNEREECLRFLDHMNINRASLFPDLDGAAHYVNDLWEVNFDKAIGHIGSA